MRKSLPLWIFLMLALPLHAQDYLVQILRSGVQDAHTFAGDYISPGAEAAMYNLSNGWYQTAEVKNFLGFEFSVIGNASNNLASHNRFFLDPSDYRNLQFADKGPGREVATIFGFNDPSIEMSAQYETVGGEQRTAYFELPQGMGESAINVFPLVFLQGRLGIFKGTEVKARYFPKITYDELEAELYGGALQHEFTSWIPGASILPVAVSGLVGYTQMKGRYNFTDRQYIEGENQILSTQIDSWVFTAIVSTKIPVFNVYGGIGYTMGTADTRMLGEYVINEEEALSPTITLEDPLRLKHEIDGVVANLGLSVTLGLFKLHADYNFQEYSTLSAGVHVGF